MDEIDREIQKRIDRRELEIEERLARLNAMKEECDRRIAEEQAAIKSNDLQNLIDLNEMNKHRPPTFKGAQDANKALFETFRRLEPIKFINGEVPPIKIRCIADILNIDDKDLRIMLKGYGVSAEGSEFECRERLADTLGVTEYWIRTVFGRP